MTQFITLAGQKQVGKDTSAQMIRSLLTDYAIGDQEVSFGSPGATSAICMNARIHVVHFADALKEACNIIFGISLEDMETEEGKRKLTKVRWPVDIMPPQSKDELIPKHHLWMAWNSYCEEFPDDPTDGDEEFMTVRQVLQFVGTELFRNQLDPDVWLNSVFLKLWAEDDVVIIADARFPNEAALGRKNGLLINVQRETGIVNDGHKSENALADYDGYHYVVQNNGSFEDLENKLEIILGAQGYFA